jgi:hypothetical protein
VAYTVSIRNNQALLLSMRVVVPWTMTLGCTARQALWLRPRESNIWDANDICEVPGGMG